MKQFTILKFNFTTMLLLFFIGAITGDGVKAQQNIRDQFLVNKISGSISDGTSCLAEYIYNANNQLIKRTITNYFFEQGVWRNGKYVEVFEYENNHVSKIVYYDSTHFRFNYDTYFFYNTEGDLIRSEQYMNGFMTEHLNYHYENGFIVSTYMDGTVPFQDDTIYYDNSGNVTERARLVGLYNPRWITDYYEYDNHPKPNFSVDYLFAYQPLVAINTDEVYEMCLSQNNMARGRGNVWIYTYNEYGLPDSYCSIFEASPPLEPMIMTIEYKQIESGISKPIQSKLAVYPNPTTGLLRIENGQVAMDMIEVFDVFGREQLSVENDPATHVDISHLPAGVYFVRVDGQTVKVVKQ